MRLACVQLRAHDLRDAEHGLQHALAMTERALEASPDLVLLPECTYPAYFIAGYGEVPLRPPAEVLGLFAGLARKGGCYLAVGLVEPAGDGTLRNSAVMLGPDGGVKARGHKHFLWHFDCRWFSPGGAPALAETPWGRVGMFICADGRLPEVPRLLALAGARLQLDLTGWVSSGRDPARLSNPQAEYMLRVRALENRCFMAAANKVGMEARRVVYCGLSQIVSPDGRVLARAGPSEPEVIVADIDPTRPLPPLWPEFDPLRDRRPAALLSLPPDHLPAPRPAAPEPGAETAQVARLGVLQASEPAVMGELLAGAGHEGVDAAVTSLLPADPGAGPRDGMPPVLLTAWQAAAGPAARLHAQGTAVTIDDRLPPEERVFSTPAGRMGVMLDREGLLPEVARSLALAGADWVAWPCRLPADLVEVVARTRAAENKIFVVAANAPLLPARAAFPAGPETRAEPPETQGWASGEGGASLVVDPDGRVLAQAFPSVEQAVAAQVHLCLARHKLIVPGTDAFGHRQPHLYGPLAGSGA